MRRNPRRNVINLEARRNRRRKPKQPRNWTPIILVLTVLFFVGYWAINNFGILALLYPSQSRNFQICGFGPRITCVVDGDTVWLNGEKIRLQGIDAPEVSEPRCATERALGNQATTEIRNILNSGEFRLSRYGTDRYGRTLGKFWMKPGKTAGQMLIDKGLAKPWSGRKAEWC